MHKGWTKNRLTNQAHKYKTKVATICTEDGHEQTNKSSKKHKPKVAKNCTGDGYNQITKTRTTI